MVNPEGQKAALALYNEAKMFIAKAEADPEHRGLAPAREMLVQAKKMMKQYKVPFED